MPYHSGALFPFSFFAQNDSRLYVAKWTFMKELLMPTPICEYVWGYIGGLWHIFYDSHRGTERW